MHFPPLYAANQLEHDCRHGAFVRHAAFDAFGGKTGAHLGHVLADYRAEVETLKEIRKSATERSE